MGLDRIGKYRILGKIGQGAMGEVYRARDPLLNRNVAIKTIAPSLGADPNFKTRFKREAQAAANLNHPHIITVFDLGEEDGLTYMAMELLEGTDLKDMIAQGKLESLREKLAVVQQVCDGVAFAHSKGVVHRDLKPGNIHIQPNGQAKVLDFGLAKVSTSDMTRTGTVMGTPHYMSPEQVRGEKVDARSDVFSLGAVFYEVLTGQRPFGRDASHNVLMRILGEEPRPIRELAPDVPDLVAAVAERALTKDREGRYADAGAMAATLRRVTQSLPPSLLYEDEPTVDPESTLMSQAEATVVMSGGHPQVAGSTALDLDRSRAEETALIGTVRPERTYVNPQTELAPARSYSWVWAVGVVFLAAVGVGTWAWLHRPGVNAPSAEATEEHVGILTEALVTSQIELAREDLENRKYEAAVDEAERALRLSPANADAQEVLDAARRTLQQRDEAAAEAQSAFANGDIERATRALGRVMSIDPQHEVVAQLSSALNEHFRQQAEQARDEAQQARRLADANRATIFPGYQQGGRSEREAASLLARNEFTGAAQKYIEARNGFERARQEADAARKTPPPTPAPTAPPRAATTAPTTTPTPVARLSTPAPTAAPVAPPTTTLPSRVASAATPAPTPAAAPTADPRAAVIDVVEKYRRAFETRDIDMFRSVYPGLSSEEEKKTRAAFGQIKEWQMDLSVASVDVQGDRATVATSRLDKINGREMPQRSWIFDLVRKGGKWEIDRMGTGK